jgi:hypothetical protein
MYENNLFWESLGLGWATVVYVVLSVLISLIFVSLPVVLLLKMMKRKAEGTLGKKSQFFEILFF